MKVKKKKIFGELFFLSVFRSPSMMPSAWQGPIRLYRMTEAASKRLKKLAAVATAAAARVSRSSVKMSLSVSGPEDGRSDPRSLPSCSSISGDFFHPENLT